MPRNFKIARPQLVAVTDPKVAVRLALGILLAANLVAAGFAFHIFDASPEALEQELATTLSQQQTAQAHLVRSRALNANLDLGKTEGEKFLTSYMTPRQYTYSTIAGELNETSKAAGMDKFAANITLNPIPGSDDLDMMSVTLNVEGKYSQLVKFINLIDRSPRFLIIESLTVTPRAKSDILTVNVKLDTFVKDDKDGIS
jgi:type IV pilus assembly protein PilO